MCWVIPILPTSKGFKSTTIALIKKQNKQKHHVIFTRTPRLTIICVVNLGKFFKGSGEARNHYSKENGLLTAGFCFAELLVQAGELSPADSFHSCSSQS